MARQRVRQLSAAAATVALLMLTYPEARETDATGITLEWDRSPDPDVAGYFVHVGMLPGIYHETFDVTDPRFTYTGGLAGRTYYFAISAYVPGPIEGPLSEEISAEAPRSEPEAERASCVAGAPCRATHIAAGPDTVNALAALDANRLLVVEGGRRIRTISSDGLRSQSVLTNDRADASFTSVVIDPAFSHTHFVYVGVATPGRDGRREFAIARYRELDGSLAEGALVVSGLAFDGSRPPLFALDDGGRIYVTVPGDAGDRLDPYAGRLLRFAPDGRASGIDRNSPVIASGYADPTALDWDGTVLWTSGTDATGTARVSTLTVGPATGSAETSSPLRATGTIPASLSAASIVALDAAASADAARTVVWLDSSERLRRLRVNGRVSTGPEDIALPGGERPLAFAVGPQGEIYLVVRSGPAFDIVRVNAPPPLR